VTDHALDPAPPEPTLVPRGRICPGCAYDLSGLASDGLCPECAGPIERALKGPLLRFASDEVLARLHLGVVLVLAGTVAQLLMLVLGIVASVGAAMSGSSSAVRSVEVIAAIGSTGVSVAVLIGWWLVSTPDPGVAARWDAPRLRRWVRITAAVQIGASVLSLFGTLARATPTGSLGIALVIGIAVTLLALAAWVAAFFVQMLYIRWLARRVPNLRVVKWAEMLMWLGPLLYTVGWVALGMGPLAAIVLFFIMLNWVREDLKRIRRWRDANPASSRLTPDAA